MRVAFVHAAKELDARVGEAFIEGVNRSGDRGVMAAKNASRVPDADVVVVFGVKCRKVWHAARALGRRTVFVDRGYLRSPHQFRVAVDDHNPTAWLEVANCSPDRARAVGFRLEPWRRGGDYVLLAGSSAKYHLWHDLPHPTEYAQAIADQLRAMGLSVLYRPKPGWDGKRPIRGAAYQRGRQGILDPLRSANCLITHGSNACIEALLAGVPCVALGNAVVRPISSTSLADAVNPRRANDADRWRLLCNLAWTQFSPREMAGGMAWRQCREMMECA